MQRPDKDSREDRVAEDRDSEFRIQRRQSPQDDSDGSKQYSNNTKTEGLLPRGRVAEVATCRATTGRAVEPITAADHAVGALSPVPLTTPAGGWALWVVSTG